MNKYSISHDWEEETIEAKARWFQSLSVERRIELLCEYTDFILELNPKIIEQKYVEPIDRSFQLCLQK